jgi:hypothetical protein
MNKLSTVLEENVVRLLGLPHCSIHPPSLASPVQRLQTSCLSMQWPRCTGYLLGTR